MKTIFICAFLTSGFLPALWVKEIFSATSTMLANCCEGSMISTRPVITGKIGSVTRILPSHFIGLTACVTPVKNPT